MRRTIDEVHVEASGQEVIQPAIAAIWRAHPVGGLSASAMHQHQRIGMTLLRHQLVAHVHLAFDDMARAGSAAGPRRSLHGLRTCAYPEEALVAQADGAGFAA